MARNISDEALFEFKDRVKGQTVLITGAAKGFGRATALAFAKYGANIVIGDIDVKGGEETVSDIKSLGSDAVFQSCNVLEYDDLVALFELGVQKFGSVDVVVPNAGVGESGRLLVVSKDDNGRPKRPNLKTLEVNFTSVVLTTQLASFYFRRTTKKNSLKSLVIIGSMSSLCGLPIAPIYASTKHALLGLTRSLQPDFEAAGMRIAIVTPWFSDTAILPDAFKVFMAGIPMVPVARVAGAVFLAATDETPETNGGVYSLPDDREVFRIPPSNVTEGVYGMLNDRVKMLRSGVVGLKTTVALTTMFLRSKLFKLILGAGIGYASYKVALAKGLV